MYSSTAGEGELQESKRPQAAFCRREVRCCSEVSCCIRGIYTGMLPAEKRERWHEGYYYFYY